MDKLGDIKGIKNMRPLFNKHKSKLLKDKLFVIQSSQNFDEA